MFATNPMRLIAAALAFSLLTLAGGAARAADGDQFVGTWHGSYSNSKGDSVAKSTITIKRDAKGQFSGTWDDYEMGDLELKGNTLSWTHGSKSKGVDAYAVTATIGADGTLHVEYKALYPAFYLLNHLSDSPEGTTKVVYTGKGDFTKN